MNVESFDRDEAVRGLIEAHYGAVLRYARRRADDATAEDVAAETFVVAWRRAEDVPREPLPWLYTVAAHLLANVSRGAVRRSALTIRLAEAGDRFTTRGPEDAVLERREALAALRSLPAPTREVLMLVGWEQLTPAEVGQVLGCTASTARVRIHRARRQLTTALHGAERQTTSVRPIDTTQPNGAIR